MTGINYFSITGEPIEISENPDGPATETAGVICPHGDVEVYCRKCERQVMPD